MEMQPFRERVLAAAERVSSRVGVDPLDVQLSRAVTTDARLELLPQSLGIGLAAMSIAVTIVSLRFLLEPASGPGLTLTSVFVIVDVLIAGGFAVCIVLARAARGRRATNLAYEDAWARLAVEIWPADRYQSWRRARGAQSEYSRTEFLLALRSGAEVDGYERHAPIIRMP